MLEHTDILLTPVGVASAALACCTLPTSYKEEACCQPQESRCPTFLVSWWRIQYLVLLSLSLVSDSVPSPSVPLLSLRVVDSVPSPSVPLLSLRVVDQYLVLLSLSLVSGWWIQYLVLLSLSLVSGVCAIRTCLRVSLVSGWWIQYLVLLSLSLVSGWWMSVPSPSVPLLSLRVVDSVILV